MYHELEARRHHVVIIEGDSGNADVTAAIDAVEAERCQVALILDARPHPHVSLKQLVTLTCV